MSDTKVDERQSSLAFAAAPESAPLVVRASGLPQEQIDVLKATICAKLSENQLLLFLTICRKRGVDPFTEAYAFPGSDGGLAFGLRIDGMRSLAMRTQEYVSRTIETILDKDGKLMGAKATIERAGMAKPVVEEAWMGEYSKKGGFGWTTYPETMIRKVAESKALRAAFPDALAGMCEATELGGDE
jgi:phage recombination protein Bet